MGKNKDVEKEVELIVNPLEKKGFTYFLAQMNKCFVVLNKKEKKSKEEIKSYNNFMRTLQGSDKLEKYKKFLCLGALKEEDKVKEAILFSGPLFLFKDCHLTPLVGTKKDTKKFGNKDIVQGLTFSADNFKCEYRIDYDEEKELHFNLDIYFNKEHLKYAILLNPSQYGRYGVCVGEAEIYNEKTSSMELKEIFSPELQKYKFWLKMTLAYIFTLQSKKEKDLNIGEVKNFLKGNNYDFDELKTVLVDTLYADEEQRVKAAIDNLKDEEQLFAFLKKDPFARKLVHKSFIREISKKNENVDKINIQENDVDSEQSVLSKEPNPFKKIS